MNNNGKTPERSPLEKLRELFIIDQNKPVHFRQQLAVMCAVLLVFCISFSAFYAVRLFADRGKETENTPSTAAEASAALQQSEEAPAPESSASSEKSEAKQENSKEESSKDESSKEESKEDDTVDISLFGEKTYTARSADDVHSGCLILVNKDFSCRTDGGNTEQLMNQKSDGYAVFDDTVALDKSIIDDVNRFFDDFASLYGETDVMMACGFRSYLQQVQLYSQEIDNAGEEEAERWVAPPGYSEHQTGYAFDLDLTVEGESGLKYKGEGIYSWLNENCGNYGLTVRYKEGKEDITGYAFEPWHFRYVGQPHSTYMENKGITLEEYLDLLVQYSYDNALLVYDVYGGSYGVYYVPAEDYGDTQIPVPDGNDYTVSGDNMNGFIVTVELN